MAKSKTEKRKQKRKQKQKQVQKARAGQASAEKGWFFYEEAIYYYETGNLPQALKFIKKAVKALPREEKVIHLMGQIGQTTNDLQVQVDAMDCLEKFGKITDLMRHDRIILLLNIKQYDLCLESAKVLLQDFPALKFDNKRQKKAQIKEIMEYCEAMINESLQQQEMQRRIKEYRKLESRVAASKTRPAKTALPAQPENAKAVANARPDARKQEVAHTQQSPQPKAEPISVPVAVNIDKQAFISALAHPDIAGADLYDLALMSHEIRFAESFETLICLPGLTLTYNPVTKQMDPVACKSCGSGTYGIGCCQNLHIICPDCLDRGCRLC